MMCQHPTGFTWHPLTQSARCGDCGLERVPVTETADALYQSLMRTVAYPALAYADVRQIAGQLALEGWVRL